MTDLRSPLEDRPYRPASRPLPSEPVISTPQYYRSWFQSLRQHRFFPMTAVSLSVLAFAGLLSYAYTEGSQSKDVNATTPIITASADAIIEKPANPGGMDVPFQDAVVFDQFQSGAQSAATNVESMLPTPEQPVDVAQKQTEKTVDTIAAALNETKAAKAQTENAATEKVEAKAVPAATKTEAANTMKQTAASAVPAQTENVAAVAKKLDNVAPASAPATTAIQTGQYRIQLGAFRDEAAARAAWSKFQKQFNSQLASVTPDFPRADLGAKGIFYRVQGVNLSKASADDLCRSLNSAKAGSCLVVK
jgi:hypothetical protein